MKLKNTLLYLSIILFLGSCVSYKKSVWFNQSESFASLKINESDSNMYVLRTGDLLDIKVVSVDAESVSMFNKTNTLSQATPAALFVNSYLVDFEGNVNLPIVGKVLIAGKTLPEATSFLQEKLKEYYKIITVDLKLLNFRITVLGEVERPGSAVVYNSQFDIMQLIGEAGGFTPYANLSNVRLIRSNINGNKQMVLIDFRKIESFNDTNFYLQPNDIIYIEPLRSKAAGINTKIGNIVLSALTLSIVLYNTITR